MHVDTTRDASICRLSEQTAKPSSSEEEQGVEATRCQFYIDMCCSEREIESGVLVSRSKSCFFAARDGLTPSCFGNSK